MVLKMNKKAQVRWVIIAILLAVIAGLVFYPDVLKPFFSKFIAFAKPITGYATGAAEKLIQNITP